MAKSSVMIDLNDPRIGDLASVISNKTSKKILALLAEKDMSESDIAKELKIPLNTVGYNMKKLIAAGLVEKTKNYFWSVKGKKIPTYRVSNKKIVISPRGLTKGILPAAIISGVIALGIKAFVNGPEKMQNTQSDLIVESERFAEESGIAAFESAGSDAGVASQASQNSGEIYNVLANAPDYWAWFLLGALTALVVFLVWNWERKTERENGQ